MDEKKVFGSRVSKRAIEKFQERLKGEEGRSVHSQGAVVEELIELYTAYGDALFSKFEDYTNTNIVNDQCNFSFSRNWEGKLEKDFKNLDRKTPGNSIPIEAPEKELKEAILVGERSVENHIKKMKIHSFISVSRQTENGTIYSLDVDLIETFLNRRREEDRG